MTTTRFGQCNDPLGYRAIMIAITRQKAHPDATAIRHRLVLGVGDRAPIGIKQQLAYGIAHHSTGRP